MTLLNEIEQAAVDSSIDISVLLRKCKVLAARLKNKDFESWIDYELGGYPSVETLPDYRKLIVESQGDFVGIGWSQMKNAPIPSLSLPGKWTNYATHEYMTQPISYYNSLIQNKGDIKNLCSPWSGDVIGILGSDIYEGWQCTSAWRVISSGSIAALLDTVRNRILSFILKIEVEIPNIGETENTKSFTEEKISQVFQTYIMGDVSNFAAGGSQNVTSIEINVNQNDIKSLKDFLKSIGVANKDIVDLEKAIEEDKSKFGDKANAWLMNMLGKAKSATWGITLSVAANLLTQALSKYFDIQM